MVNVWGDVQAAIAATGVGALPPYRVRPRTQSVKPQTRGGVCSSSTSVSVTLLGVAANAAVRIPALFLAMRYTVPPSLEAIGLVAAPAGGGTR